MGNVQGDWSFHDWKLTAQAQIQLFVIKGWEGWTSKGEKFLKVEPHSITHEKNKKRKGDDFGTVLSVGVWQGRQ